MDQPLLSFFPAERPADPDPRARRITVGDVVHMESGLDCGYAPGEQELELMKQSPDFVRFALSLPMRYDPGTHASYCSPGYHLLGSLVAAAAHRIGTRFCPPEPVRPLGNPHRGLGRPTRRAAPTAGATATCSPKTWPRSAISTCTAANGKAARSCPATGWLPPSFLPPAAAAIQEAWATSGTWSGDPRDCSSAASGRGGQSLIVWPDLDTVVVILAGGNPGRIAGAIRQAIQSDRPLAPNPEA